MKQKLIIIAAALTLVLSGVPEAGAQWVQVGLAGYGVTCFGVNGSNLFAGTLDSGVFRSTDDGATWTASNGLPPDTIPDNYRLDIDRCIVVSGNYLFAGIIGGGNLVYLSTNNGFSWNLMSNGLLPLSPQPTGPQLIALAVSDTNIFVDVGGVFLSTNNGTSWVSVDSGLGTKMFPLCLAADGGNIFAGGGSADSDAVVFLSTDNGATWHSASIGLPNGLGNVTVLSTNNNNIYAGIGDGSSSDGWVFVSTNEGTSWREPGLNFPANRGPVTSFAFSGKNVFAGLDNGGVYMLADTANSWIEVNSGLDSNLGSQDTGVSALTVADGYIFAGSGGVWRRPLSDFGIAAVAPSTSIQNSITAYPNPLSQSTTISFSSPESGVAEVTIVNLLGAEVKRIFSGEIEAGEHTFAWDAISEPPGMYECVVRMNGNSQEIPIILTK